MTDRNREQKAQPMTRGRTRKDVFKMREAHRAPTKRQRSAFCGKEECPPVKRSLSDCEDGVNRARRDDVTTKEWLSRGRGINERLTELTRERQKIFDLCTNVTGSITPDKVRSSPGNSSEKRMTKLAEIAMEIESERDELIDVIEEIKSAIRGVEDITLRRLLSLRYIEFMTWEQIAEEMGYSDYWVRTKLHRTALREIEKSRGD